MDRGGRGLWITTFADVSGFVYLSTVDIFAFEFLIWISIDIRVLPTQESISGPTYSTLERQKHPSESQAVVCGVWVGVGVVPGR